MSKLKKIIQKFKFWLKLNKKPILRELKIAIFLVMTATVFLQSIHINNMNEQYKLISEDYAIQSIHMEQIVEDYDSLMEENSSLKELNKNISQEINELNSNILEIETEIESTSASKNNVSKLDVDGGDKIYDIPLSDDLQRYIAKQSAKHNLSYEVVIGLIHTESTFRSNVTSYNGTSVGLLQINQYNTLDWLANEVNLSEVDPFNPYHSVKMGTWYLEYLKQYWRDRGLSEDNARNAMLISFHRGLGGAKTYIRNNGYTSNYTRKVLNYQNQLN